MPERTADRGYSGTPLPRKLGIREGSEVFITAEGARGRLAGGPYDVIVFFALTQGEVARRFRRLAAKLEPNGRLWIGWPKRSSGIATDITENSLRDIVLPAGLVDNKVAAIGERWSGLQFVWRLKNRPY
jgi:protein-L-isoaspartate O-methyltransferase